MSKLTGRSLVVTKIDRSKYSAIPIGVVLYEKEVFPGVFRIIDPAGGGIYSPFNPDPMGDWYNNCEWYEVTPLETYVEQAMLI